MRFRKSLTFQSVMDKKDAKVLDDEGEEMVNKCYILLKFDLSSIKLCSTVLNCTSSVLRVAFQVMFSFN